MKPRKDAWRNPRAARRVSGTWLGLSVTLAVLVTTTSCTSVNGGETQSSTNPPDARCHDVIVPAGAFGVEVAAGYDAAPHRFDQSADLRICLRGFMGQIVFVEAPPGVEVDPPSMAVGQTNQAFLRFTVRAQPHAHGALRVEIRFDDGSLSTRALPTPKIVTTDSNWRMVP